MPTGIWNSRRNRSIISLIREWTLLSSSALIRGAGRAGAKRRRKQGIKVIAYDRMIMDSDIDLYITFDNERVGTMMGEALTGG